VSRERGKAKEEACDQYYHWKKKATPKGNPHARQESQENTNRRKSQEDSDSTVLQGDPFKTVNKKGAVKRGIFTTLGSRGEEDGHHIIPFVQRKAASLTEKKFKITRGSVIRLSIGEERNYVRKETVTVFRVRIMEGEGPDNSSQRLKERGHEERMKSVLTYYFGKASVVRTHDCHRREGRRGKKADASNLCKRRR